MDSLDSLPRDREGFRLRGLDTTRIENFTDAAFAFALTLLVISIEPPRNLEEMQIALQGVPAFLASATLLMAFWWGHHHWSRRYGLDDGPTLALSCLLVFTVLIYVYPLRFMFGTMFRWIGFLTGWPLGTPDMSLDGPHQLRTVFIVYGFGFLAMSLALGLLNLHAWRRRDDLGLDAGERIETEAAIGVWLVHAAAALLSIALAALTTASAFGVPGWAYATIPLGVWLNMRRASRRRSAAGLEPLA